MANIKEAFEYAAKNPTSDFANNLKSLAQSGALNLEAQKYGIDLSPFQPKVETPTPANENNATFRATGNESLAGAALKTVGNIPSSAKNLATNVVDAVTHPKRTVGAVVDVVKGAGAKVGELAFEKTGIGQQLLAAQSAKRVEAGMPALKQDNKGRFQVEDTPELAKFKELGNYISNRYGSEEAFKKSVIEDPVGVLADISSVITGAGAAVTAVGDVSKVAKVSEVGNVISKVGQATEPITAISKTAGKVSSAVKNSTPGRIASDIIPSANGIRSGEVTKAIDLTQGDVSSIKKLTGNDPAGYIVSKGIIKGTPEEIADNLNTIRKDTMVQVRDEIGKVKNVYQTTAVPSVKKGLDVILKGVDEVPGLEPIAEEIRTLANKTDFTLSDIQRAKELIDENSNIYSKMGDVKSSSTAKGLANIRQELKTFIENEVDTATGGQTNIKGLNNDVQTSYEIEQAIKNRATRSLTRQGLSVFDGILGAGGAAAFGPAIGIGLVVAKKVAETPAFRLALAKALSLQPATRLKAILSELKTKNLSPATIKIIQGSMDAIKQNAQYIEAGSNALQNTTGQ